ncbi:MAG: imidazole glycerol phosphate synthase subunit HisF [Oscillospiraceae bacterium]|nr:imidazole glycerol phosphate synthase subunit HisF [Oscillospiraceae bacterium]
MIIKKIIPCLDVRNGKVVKGRQFRQITDVADPAELAKKYNEQGADELVFYDITATAEGRELFDDALKKVIKETFVPLTAGGGINTIEDCGRLLNMGADKVSINSGALRDPNLVKNAASKYGSQCIVLSMDIKRAPDGRFMVYSHVGIQETEYSAVDWAKKAEADGAGELVINSIDTDGVKEGFDLQMLQVIAKSVSIPIVASGGAGKTEDFIELFKSIDNVDSALAASIFHYGEINIKELKTTLLQNGINVRI